MRKRIPKILVTGGAGFIGSAFVRLLAGAFAQKKLSSKEATYKIVVLDKLTYAADLRRLESVKNRYKFYQADICDAKKIRLILEKETPDFIVNFSAETHVDRSIRDCAVFIRTNVLGTQTLLSQSRKIDLKKFIHISTDEVYGDIRKGSFYEDDPLIPSSPYSASKAASDLLLKSYIRTYGFPAVIVRPCNNYGPWQYPEKLIPLSILKIFKNQKVPLYADGKNVREWLYVDDCARGILKVMQQGKIGQIYNLGSDQEKQNIEVIRMLLGIMGASEKMIQFVRDRPGHDIRYRLNSQKIKKTLCWFPRINLERGLRLTLAWAFGYRNWLLDKCKDISRLYQ
jgi:dTDP-glucose 4,6-dehydratase